MAINKIIRNQMKRYIHIILAAAFALFFSGCSKETAPAVDDGISGEWRLTSWNGTAPGEDFSVYMALSSDGSFTLYQKVYTPTFERLDGTYSADGTIFSGTYSDGEPLSAVYTYGLSQDGITLTMTATGTENDDISIYTRTNIPDEVLSAPVSTKAGDGSHRRFL